MSWTAGPSLRRGLLTFHVATSVGWVGSVVAYVALHVPVLVGSDATTVRAAHLMMEPVAFYAIAPLAISSTLSGVLQAWVTPWGLFRHYWVLISLVLTLFATTVLLLHLPAVSKLAGQAADPAVAANDLDGDLFHAVGGLVVLLIPLILNIYKPRGLTPYGWRVQRPARRSGPDQPSGEPAGATPPSGPTPRRPGCEPAVRRRRAGP